MNLPVKMTAAPLVWWTDRNMVSLVKRTAFKDCNDAEFDTAVAVSRELNLSPLRKQIYAFVFNKNDAKKRNMVLVVGIDGGRSIAARSGNYRPDNQEPQWVFKDELKDPLTNPHGIEKCTVGVFHRPTRDDPFERIVHTVYWEEFAPLLKKFDPEDMVDSGETWPDGNPKKRPRAGAKPVLQLDPNKDAWIKAGRNQIAKCAEFGALRKGWPEDLSMVYAPEETDRAQALEGVEYEDITPSGMANAAEADKRQDMLGGPALFAILDNTTGNLERIPIGKFADTMLATTQKMKPAEVAELVGRNKQAINEFWAHNKTDALALKKELEARSKVSPAGSNAYPSSQGPAETAAPAASPPLTPSDAAGAGSLPAKEELLTSIEQIESKLGCLQWATNNKVAVNALGSKDRSEVMAAYYAQQDAVPA